MFTVLDVSRWQGRIDWDTVKASGRVHGVMLRALGSRSGTPYIDPMFETNYSACTRLGIPVGVYGYFKATTRWGSTITAVPLPPHSGMPSWPSCTMPSGESGFSCPLPSTWRMPACVP